MKKMWTLLKKDLWTSFTDKTIVLMLFTPVMLGIIFRIVTYDTWMILLTMSLFNLVLAPLCNFPLLITEEKDRGTLPLLFRSKVTVGQFTASKAAASLLTGECMSAVVFFIAGADPALLPQYLLINLVCMASFLPYGFLTALYARDQNSVNVYSTLSVILAFVIPVFSYWNLAFGSIAVFIPTSFMGTVLSQVNPVEGFLDSSPVWSLAVCVIWFAAGLAILCAVRKKRAFFPVSAGQIK